MATSKRKSPAGRSGPRTPNGSDTADDPVKSDRLPADEARDAGSGESARSFEFPDFERTRLAERIEPDEVMGWARMLDVSPQRLREAMGIVGPIVEDVRRYLTKPH
jgi:hypothetical protein